MDHLTTSIDASSSGRPGTEKAARKKRPTFDPEYIRDLSETVYRLLLEQDCAGNVARMIEKDEDNGEKLRNRAAFYDRLTRTYLKVLGADGERERCAAVCEEWLNRYQAKEIDYTGAREYAVDAINDILDLIRAGIDPREASAVSGDRSQADATEVAR